MSKRKKPEGCVRIKRSDDGQFYGLYQAEGNRKTLAPTETMKQKASVINNIESMARLFKGTVPLIIDETA